MKLDIPPDSADLTNNLALCKPCLWYGRTMIRVRTSVPVSQLRPMNYVPGLGETAWVVAAGDADSGARHLGQLGFGSDGSWELDWPGCRCPKDIRVGTRYVR